MNVAAGPELAAAVTNAGGLGVIGGFGYTPKFLRQQVSPSWWCAASGAELVCPDSSYQEGLEGQKCTLRRRLVDPCGWRYGS